MKKFLLTLFVALSIQISCFAAGAATGFAKEEKAADQLVAGITGNTITYEQVYRECHSELKKNLTAENFAALKKNVKEKVGTVKNINFVAFYKRYNLQTGYANIDDLVYFGTAEKDKVVRFIVTFTQENGAPKISEFAVIPVEPQPEAKTDKKKK